MHSPPNPSAHPIRVALVEDQGGLRESLAKALAGVPGITCVASCANAEQALVELPEVRPHVVLMDINMPRMNGIKATAHITSEYPQTKIIGLSVNAAGENQELMTRAGAVCLIPKEQVDDLLYDAIQVAVKSR